MSNGTSQVKLAEAAAHALNQQNVLLGELHSAYVNQAKLAAALCQAVKLAKDGIIDVCDVEDTAQQLIKDGSVKLSSVDALFTESPGRIVESGTATEQLDPLTGYLRGSWKGPT
jgi:hypothetical protein